MRRSMFFKSFIIVRLIIYDHINYYLIRCFNSLFSASQKYLKDLKIKTVFLNTDFFIFKSNFRRKKTTTPVTSF